MVNGVISGTTQFVIGLDRLLAKWSKEVGYSPIIVVSELEPWLVRAVLRLIQGRAIDHLMIAAHLAAEGEVKLAVT